MAENILIAYYSWANSTKKIAEEVSKITGGTLFEIAPAVAYTTDYDEVVEQAKKEIDAGVQPELAADLDIAAYDAIFIGTPNWWSTMAPPVATFLTGKDFTGKTVVPFCSHGGAGWSRIREDIAALCQGSNSAEGFSVYNGGGSDMPRQVEKWLNEIGYVK